MNWKYFVFVVLILVVTITGCSGKDSQLNSNSNLPSTPNTSNTESELLNWELTEVFFEETNVIMQTSSYSRSQDGCIQAQTASPTCEQSSSTGFTLSLELEASLGTDMASVSLSPSVEAMINQTRSSGDSTTWETPYGFYDTFTVEINSIVNHGKGTFLNSLGESLQGNLTYITGTCTVTISNVERNSCANSTSNTNVPENPTPAPVATATQNVTATSTVTQAPRVIISEIIAGSTDSITVNNNQIHVLFLGPGTVDGNVLYGGETHGNVVILLPRNEPYILSNLNPGYTWHGAFIASEDQWKSLAIRYDAEVRQPGKCTNGAACQTVDFLVISANGYLSYP